MRNAYIYLTFCLAVLLSSCGSKQDNSSKSVLHLFSDAELVEAQGALQYPEDNKPLPSMLTYPHDSALWMTNWQGKQALRFESNEAGDLRGSLYSFHKPLQKNFELSLSSWMDISRPESWNGIVFWMGDNIKRAVGVRWKTIGVKNELSVQMFNYHFPHANPILKRSLPIDNSHWADIKHSVQDNQISFTIDDQPTITLPAQEKWHLGDRFGLFQGLGTGFFADLTASMGDNQYQFDDLFQKWNNEMVKTTRKILLEKTATPDDFVGKDIPVRRLAIADDWRTTVPVHCPSQLVYRVSVPANAVLHSAFGILPPFSLVSTAAEFQIIARTSNDNEKILASKIITPVNEPLSSFRFHDNHISLAEYAGREIDLIFKLSRQGGEEPLIACWAEPVIGVSKPKKKKTNVVLILLDTLRADRVGVYGNKRGLTPYIDQLANDGSTFMQTVSQAPWTTPSHASFFTGLYPSETGCSNPGSKGNRLQESYQTWAERLQQTGYSTAAFTSGIAVRGDLGFNQGFDRYYDMMYDSSYSYEAVHQRACEWWDAHQGEPFFLFLHTYAVHFPYKHQQFLEYRNIARTWDDQKLLDDDAYDGGVRYADEWTGSILRELKQRNLFDSTLIIVASDHGEDLGERGMPRPSRHGHTLYDELLRVPLIFHLPGSIPEGKKINQQVRLLDMMPTVLDVLGLEQPVIQRGKTLLPLMQGKKEIDRFSYSDGMTYGTDQKAVRTESFKYIFAPDINAKLDNSPTGYPMPVPVPIQLYDLKSDPAETNNIAAQQPKHLQDMQAIYQYIQSESLSPEFFTSGDTTLEPPAIPADVMEKMQNLGYAAKP